MPLSPAAAAAPAVLPAGTPNTSNLVSSEGIAGEVGGGWRRGRATYYGGPASFTDAYTSRGLGSFGVLEYGSCGYTDTPERLAFPRVSGVPCRTVSPCRGHYSSLVAEFGPFGQ